VNRSINKIEKGDSSIYSQDAATIQSYNFRYFMDKNGRLQERKKKGRLYSLGGNDPPRKYFHGRLDRLQTVGTFDLGCEMSILGDMALNFNEKIINTDFISSKSGAAENASSMGTNESYLMNTPSESHYGEMINSSCSLDQTQTNKDFKTLNKSLFDGKSMPNFQTQRSAEEPKKEFFEQLGTVPKKFRSLSTSAYSIPPLISSKQSLLEKEVPYVVPLRPRRHVLAKSSKFDHSASDSIECTAVIETIPDAKKYHDEIDFSTSPVLEQILPTVSSDELDKVFSDDTELKQLEKDYREHIKSKFQREYKSDGDGLDEVGKKVISEYKRNQSFENELNFCEDLKPSTSFSDPNTNYTKIIEVMEQLESVPDEKPPENEVLINSIEKKIGRFKKMNNLLKSKRFSTSALYEKGKPLQFFTKTIDGSSKSSEKSSLSPSSKRSVFSQIARTKFSLQGTQSFFSKSNSDIKSVFAHNREQHDNQTNDQIPKKVFSRFNSRNFSKKPKRYQQPDYEESNTCTSPLSEAFYNETGSTRLSAMELFEKFCSQDFGGLYKHEDLGINEPYTDMASFYGTGSSSNYFNFHQNYRHEDDLRRYEPHNSRLLRQKSEPKFFFRNEPAYENYTDEIIEEDYYDDPDNSNLYYHDDYGESEEYGGSDEYYYEEAASPVDSKHVSTTDPSSGDSQPFAFTDSDVDEIYLMPNRKKPRKSGNDDISYETDDSVSEFASNQTILYFNRKLDNFENLKESEILTIYRIFSKNNLSDDTKQDNLPSVLSKQTSTEETDSDDIEQVNNLVDKLNINNSDSDDRVNQIQDADAAGSDEEENDNIEKAINQYIKNSSISDISIDGSMDPYFIRSDCVNNKSSSYMIDRSTSIELLSNSSGTTYTEYALDTVKNVNLESCCSSTSKLSLSLKSEIFDDFTLTPDEIKMIKNCEMDDFTLTPEKSSLSIMDEIGTIDGNNQKTVDHDNEQAISQIDFVELVNNFLVKERNSDIQMKTNIDDENENVADTGTGNSEYTIIDVDEENSMSKFTTDITKEFDVLFSKAIDNEENISDATTSRDSTKLSKSFHEFKKMMIPSRYSMQKLEPLELNDSSTSIVMDPRKQAEPVYNNTPDIDTDTDIVLSFEKRQARSQSVGNLNRRSKCFPL
jgi:hypothetical protein